MLAMEGSRVVGNNTLKRGCRRSPASASRCRTPLERKVSGDHSGRVTPVPIPNTEVKPACADGTWGETPWESRSSPEFISDNAHLQPRVGIVASRRPPLLAAIGQAAFGGARYIRCAQKRATSEWLGRHLTSGSGRSRVVPWPGWRPIGRCRSNELAALGP